MPSPVDTGLGLPIQAGQPEAWLRLGGSSCCGVEGQSLTGKPGVDEVKWRQ